MATFAQPTAESRAAVVERQEAADTLRTEASSHAGGGRVATAPPAVDASVAHNPAATALGSLQRALDHSPRVQAQLTLQRMLNRRAGAAAAPVPQSGRPVAQLAKLNLRANGTISGVSQWPKRPSSNVSGKQGQHLTAYVAFTDMILSQVRDRTVPEAADALSDVLDSLQALPGGDTWYKTYKAYIDTAQQELTDAGANNDAKEVGRLINDILSLRNKMPDTAIATRERTWGHGESKTSGSLEVLENLLRQNGGTLPAQYDDDEEADAALANMWRLLDYQPKSGGSAAAMERTQNRVLRHVQQMRLSYPEVFSWLTARGAGSWLMPYIEDHRDDNGMPLTDLDDMEIDEVKDFVHQNL